MAIFSHKYGMEPNVDHLEVLAPEGRNILRFLQQSPGDVGDVSTECTLDRGAVERLYSALGEWLYPQTQGPAPYALEQAFAALTDAVNATAAAVRPLWNSPAAYVDPEPRDVGHPQPVPECTPCCAHPGTDHGLTGCMGTQLDFECGCMQTKYDFTDTP